MCWLLLNKIYFLYAFAINTFYLTLPSNEYDIAQVRVNQPHFSFVPSTSFSALLDKDTQVLDVSLDIVLYLCKNFNLNGKGTQC